MAELNIEKIINTKRGTINPRYDIPYSAVEVIREKSTGETDAVCNGFLVGYIQGVKAAKAEMRKVGALNE